MIERCLPMLAAAFLTAGPAAAQNTPELIARSELRVCADPNSLPFSNDKQEGFENRIAALIGEDLKLPVNFTWYPQSVGFVRKTLAARRCDLVIGTVSGDSSMETSTAYYHTGYMIVTRPDEHIDATSIADPVLADKKIGLIAATPPTDLVLRHGLMPHVTAYSLVVDTRFESPSRQLLQDLVDKKIDVGFVWGPIAGYYIHHDHLPLRAEFLAEEPGGPRLDYHIAMGVRGGETEWRRKINAEVRTLQPKITAILEEYGVPLLDEQNQAMPATSATAPATAQP